MVNLKPQLIVNTRGHIIALESSDHEYERAGVPEYWIIDPLIKQCRFYRLNNQGAYILQEAENKYQSSQLPDLIIDTDILWQDDLPKPPRIVKTVEKMLSE